MFNEKKPKNWSERYWNQIERNIGFVKFSEQEILRQVPVAVLGVGGLGGPLAEQLVRMGCEHIVICDNDRFEESNLNRQICLREDIGKNKVDVVQRLLENINPEASIEKYYDINEKNVSKVLNGVKIVALTLDDPIASIIISRECSNKNIPLIESWGVPYLCSWWFTPESVDYETCYELNTKELSIQQIVESENIQLTVKKAFLNKVLKFPGLKETCDREKGSLEDMSSGKLALRSFAPMVRMTASYLALDIILTGILKVKLMVLAPRVIAFDYIRLKQIEFSMM
ncbi:MAG: ThiF family adenylyltransferase [Promethearchaeota archaeon]